jgi:hypothetical protein
MTDDREAQLTEALRQLARDDAQRVAASAVEARLRGEVRRIAARRALRTRVVAMSAVAALVVAAVVATDANAPQRAGRERDGNRSRGDNGVHAVAVRDGTGDERRDRPARVAAVGDDGLARAVRFVRRGREELK